MRPRPPTMRLHRLQLSVGGMLVAVALAALFLHFVALPLRESAHASACSQNLKAIGLALHGYHDAYGCFPPASVADDQGRPMHSWRVLILPFAGQENLNRSYRFDEPRDGPNNRTLVGRMPRFYACPAQSRRTSATQADYLAI